MSIKMHILRMSARACACMNVYARACIFVCVYVNARTNRQRRVRDSQLHTNLAGVYLRFCLIILSCTGVMKNI